MIGGYYVILAPGNLYNALVSDDASLFRTQLTNFALVATAVLIVKVIRGALRESATNLLRKRLTDALHRRYFGNSQDEMGYGASPYYRIANDKAVDNPDQRIVADARHFSNSLFDIVAGGQTQGPDSGGLLEATASVFFYSNKTLLRTGWYGVLVAYFWSILVTAVSVFVINRTSPVVFRQEKLEADFRYGHTELRRHAEEVAFMRGAPFERRKLTAYLDRAVSNTWSVIIRHVFLNIVQYGFGYYISIVMYLALAIAIHTNIFESTGTTFSSHMTPGEKAQWISQTGGIFLQLLFSFTMLVQLGTVVSIFVSNSNRVSALLDALSDKSVDTPLGSDNSDAEPLLAREDVMPQRTMYCDESSGIAADHICVRPGDSSQIGPISFNLTKGQWLLINGPSGSGKTSILRTLRGLWIPSSGKLCIPKDERAVMFVPQVPYITSGTCSLRELVLYPGSPAFSGDETSSVIHALEEVGWRSGDLRETIDKKEDWSARLSPGEAQLIAASRVVFSRPAYAVLDEPTSSLDAKGEETVLKALKRAGISALTVGHSRSLPALHDKVVTIEEHEPS